MFPFSHLFLNFDTDFNQLLTFPTMLKLDSFFLSASSGRNYTWWYTSMFIVLTLN